LDVLSRAGHVKSCLNIGANLKKSPKIKKQKNNKRKNVRTITRSC
jgi:hypothetical protein